MEDSGLKIRRNKYVYLRPNGDGHFVGNSEINLQGLNLKSGYINLGPTMADSMDPKYSGHCL